MYVYRGRQPLRIRWRGRMTTINVGAELGEDLRIVNASPRLRACLANGEIVDDNPPPTPPVHKPVADKVVADGQPARGLKKSRRRKSEKVDGAAGTGD